MSFKSKTSQCHHQAHKLAQNTDTMLQNLNMLLTETATKNDICLLQEQVMCIQQHFHVFIASKPEPLSLYAPSLSSDFPELSQSWAEELSVIEGHQEDDVSLLLPNLNANWDSEFIMSDHDYSWGVVHQSFRPGCL